MLHRRPTITIATSALIFFCIALHAQNSAASQKSSPHADAETYKIYQSLLPADWTVALAQRLLIQAQTGTMGFKPGSGSWHSLGERYPYSAYSYIVLSPVAFNADGPLCGEETFHLLEKKDGIWKNLRWKGTACGWAS